MTKWTFCVFFRDDALAFKGIRVMKSTWHERVGGGCFFDEQTIEICLIFALASTSCHLFFFNKRGWKHRPRRSIKAHNYSSLHMHEASACKMSAMLCQPLTTASSPFTYCSIQVSIAVFQGLKVIVYPKMKILTWFTHYLTFPTF